MPVAYELIRPRDNISTAVMIYLFFLLILPATPRLLFPLYLLYLSLV